MKQLIISKTLIFIFVLLFVTGFQAVFGQQNVLIGVTTVVALLMYLERDLTVSPGKNLLMLLSINLLQGVLGQLAILNPWIGLPLNFLAMFIVGYFFTSTIKKPFYIAFGLQYLFILTTPVSLGDFPMRLLSLVTGAIVIMITQWLFNRHKLSKQSDKYLVQTCEHLQAKINLIRDNQENPQLDSKIYSSINELRKIIYFRRIKGYYLTHESRVRLKISVCLEKLHLILSRTNKKDFHPDALTVLNQELDMIKDFIENRTPLSNHSLDTLDKSFTQTENVYILEMLSTLKLLHELLIYIDTSESTELNKVEKVLEVPKIYRIHYHHFKNLSKHSVRFTYAIRLGITIAIAAFISDYFHIEDGRWLIFTVFSITQPYSEIAKFRFKERIIGTLIGAAIFIVLFSLFKDPTNRSFLVLIAGYLNSFAVQYRNIVWTVTISALGSASLMGDPNILTIRRLSLVLAGIGLGMLANRFILPHTLEKGTKELMETYKQTTKEMLREVHGYLIHQQNAHTINNLFAITTLMEERIVSNNEFLDLKKMNEFLFAQRHLNHAIYELFLRLQRQDVNKQLLMELMDQLDTTLQSDCNHLDDRVNNLYNRLHHSKSKEEYIFFKDVLRIFKGLRKQGCYE